MKNLVRFFEIPTNNFSRGVNFYQTIFGLELKECDCGIEKMAFFPENEGAVIYAENFNSSSDGVVISFDAGEDLDIMLDKIIKAGGKIIIGKTKIEAEGRGFFAVFIDSEGNKIGLYADS